MYRLQHYLQYTIRQFFHDRYVRVEILKLVKSATASISVSWSNITGSISDNAALQNALDSKADSTDLDNKADKTTTITAGTGLTGGGNLSANRTIALNSASIASLAKADSAVQNADLAPYSKTADIQSSLDLADSSVQPDDLSTYATTAALTSGLATKADQSDLTTLSTTVNGKLTASQGAAVTDATDETDVVAQFNTLLANLRTAGIIAS